MNRYTWSRKEIIDKIKKLEVLNKEKQYINDLNVLYEILGFSTSFNLKIDSKLKEQIELSRPLLEKIICKVDNISSFKMIDFPEEEIINLSDDEILTLVHDFYKECNNQLYNLFLKVFNNRNLNLNIKESIFKNLAKTYHLLKSIESYIYLEKNGTIADAISLVHEYGHSITFLMNPNLISNINFIFLREIDGLFFETKFIEYLIKNNIFKEEAILQKANDYKKQIRNGQYLNYINFDLYKAVYYYSFFVSIELCSQNFQQAQEMLIKIFKSNPQSIVESFEIINSYVTVGDNINNYEKILKKELDRCFR